MTLEIYPFMMQEDALFFARYFEKLGWHKPLSQFEHYIQEAAQLIRTNFVAKLNHSPIGYVTIVWRSEHLYFQEQNIPEIKDLNVFPEQQGKDFGKALLQAAEECVFERCNEVGLGVGLTQDYAIAQKLYIKQGYVPDGTGIHYQNKALRHGETALVDDDLVLYLTKRKK